MVGLDGVITQIDKLEEDLSGTINDGIQFLRTVEDFRNGVAKYQGGGNNVGSASTRNY